MGTYAIQARITGQVQGVGFRAWTQAVAVRQGLAGWVRNDISGAVMAHFEGPRDAVDEMVKLLWSGPAAAAVSDVQATPCPPEMPSGFRIAY